MQKKIQINAPIPGFLRITDYGWLRIHLDTLLPDNRTGNPGLYLKSAELLLRGYVAQYGRLPFFEKALLVILESCNIENRRAFDQDNKAWKGIPNLLKGLVIEDDDQFHLEIALLTDRSNRIGSDIFVLPSDDAEAFFALRSGMIGGFA